MHIERYIPTLDWDVLLLVSLTKLLSGATFFADHRLQNISVVAKLKALLAHLDS